MNTLDNKMAVMKWLDELRDNQDFDNLKEIRDYLRFLIRIGNNEWYDLDPEVKEQKK
jgi:hypothetical protein